MSYEGLDEKEELQTVPVVINNNYMQLVILTMIQAKMTSKTMMTTFLMKTLTNKSKQTPKPLSMQKWYKQWISSKLHIVTMPTKLLRKQHKKNFLIDLAMVTSNTKPVPEEPKTFNKAWDHPDANSWAKWQEVICKEFANMNKQQVWHMTSKSLMPSNCRCRKNKWFFKIKHNGVYWMHLVSCGYS